jgi:hypothetical protein
MERDLGRVGEMRGLHGLHEAAGAIGKPSKDESTDRVTDAGQNSLTLLA